MIFIVSLQLLRDNLTLWTSDTAAEGEEAEAGADNQSAPIFFPNLHQVQVDAISLWKNGSACSQFGCHILSVRNTTVIYVRKGTAKLNLMVI